MFQKLRIFATIVGLLTVSSAFATSATGAPKSGRSVTGKVIRLAVHPGAASGNCYFAFKPDPQEDRDKNKFSGEELLWIYTNFIEEEHPQMLPYTMSILNSALTESLGIVAWFHERNNESELHGIRLTNLQY